MKITVLLKIESGAEERVDTEALSRDSAYVSISADNMDAAQALLPIGQKQAEAAMDAWTDYGMLQDAAAESGAEQVGAAAYEATVGGQRFVASIGNAKQFWLKHANTKRSITYGQLLYLSDKCNNVFLEGCFDVCALSYRSGYRDAQTAFKITSTRKPGKGQKNTRNL